jgi:hypothetical protein
VDDLAARGDSALCVAQQGERGEQIRGERKVGECFRQALIEPVDFITSRGREIVKDFCEASEPVRAEAFGKGVGRNAPGRRYVSDLSRSGKARKFVADQRRVMGVVAGQVDQFVDRAHVYLAVNFG